MLASAINVSEGRPGRALDAIVASAGDGLLDLHRDEHHNRSVLTFAGPRDHVLQAARRVAQAAVAHIDLRDHHGVHPRIGALDVVPFTPLEHATLADAVAARDEFAAWAGAELLLPCFLYGPDRTLPDVRRLAFGTLAPDTGPPAPHPTAGACAVGARPVLVAYNVWLAQPDLALARSIARAIRGQAVRALGLAVGTAVQVSMNLVDPKAVGPLDAYEFVAARAPVARAELVGLVPGWVLDAVPRDRWRELDLDLDRTIEGRLGLRR